MPAIRTQPAHWNSASQRTERPASISSSSRQLDYNSINASDASLGFGKSRQSCWSALVQQPCDSGNNNTHTMVAIDYAPGPDCVSKVMVKRVVPIHSPIAATCPDVQRALPPDCPDVAATRNVGASKPFINEMNMMMKPDGTGIFKGSLVSCDEGNKTNLNLMSSHPNAGVSPEKHCCHKAASQQGQNRNDAPKVQPKRTCRAAEMPPEIPMEPPNVHRRPSKTPEEPSNLSRRPSNTPGKSLDVHRRPSKTSDEPPHAHRRSSKTPEKPPNAQRRSSKTPEKPHNAQRRSSKTPGEPQNVPRRPSKAPEEHPTKLQQEKIKSQRKLSNAAKEQPIVSVKKVTDTEQNETESKNLRSRSRTAAKVDCDSLLNGTRRDRRNSRVTFAQESGAAGSHCCKPNVGSISKCEEVKRLDIGSGREERKPESYAIYNACNKKSNSGGKNDECVSHDKVQVRCTPGTGHGSWGKQRKASDKNAIKEQWQRRHPCATESKANMSEEPKDIVTESFSSAGEVQSKVYNHQCKQKTSENRCPTKKMQQQSDGCGGVVRSETTLIYKTELETFPYESGESSTDKYNAESDSEAIVEIELDSRTNDTDERAGACGSQSTGTQTEPDRGSRSENPCQPERWKPAGGSLGHTRSESRSEKPGQPEKAKPQPPDYPSRTAGEQHQNRESHDIPKSCSEALRHDAELKKRREAADRARCETMQKLITKRPDITTDQSERERKRNHVQSQWKKTTDANVEVGRAEKPVEEAPSKICPGGNHPAEKSTGRKCSPDPPDTKWVREGNLLVKMSDGQPSSFKVLRRDVGCGDIYSTEGSAWDINELVPPPEEAIVDESAEAGERIKTEEDSEDPLTGKTKKCCC